MNRLLADLAGRIDVPFRNLTSSLREEVGAGGSLNWKYGDHLTSKGNRFVAETVSAWIESERVFHGLH